MRKQFGRAFAVSLLILAAGAIAEAADETPQAVTTPATVTAPAQAALPLVPPATELKGVSLVDALRKGGYVLYMRHALQIPPITDNCNEPSLKPEGIRQARSVGAAIRELKIPIGSVRSSEVCRVRETAKLLELGDVMISEGLNPAGQREGVEVGPLRTQLLREIPRAGTNTLLVSHVHGSKDKTEWMHLELAEIIVFRPDGKSALPVARIREEAWAALIESTVRQK